MARCRYGQHPHEHPAGCHPGIPAGRNHWINTGQTYGWVLDGQWDGHAAQIAASTLLWVIVPWRSACSARCAGTSVKAGSFGIILSGTQADKKSEGGCIMATVVEVRRIAMA